MSDQDSNPKQTGHTPPKSSPLPWDVDANMVVSILGEDADGVHVREIAEMCYPHDPDAPISEDRQVEADANFIVLAVNSHAALAEENALLRKALRSIAAQVELVPFARRTVAEDEPNEKTLNEKAMRERRSK